jgi:hypothetical protein
MRAFTQLIFIDDQDGGAGKLAVAKFFQCTGFASSSGKVRCKSSRVRRRRRPIKNVGQLGPNPVFYQDGSWTKNAHLNMSAT